MSNIQQPLSINTNGLAPDSSAILDIQSTTAGVLVPRMLTSQRMAIPSPGEGLLVYDTEISSFWFFDGGDWREVNLNADDDPSNELQDLDLNSNILSISNHSSPTPIDLSLYLDNTDTQLNEAEVDAHVANNGYLTAEVDADSTNELELPVEPIQGEMTYWDGNSWIALPPGSTGQTLNFCRGLPTWGPCPPVLDSDGNEYSSVTIGTQEWMAQNLRTTTYNDGTPIELVTDSASWTLLNSPAYCWPNGDISNSDPYGLLYNFMAISDTNSLNVCPIGWHVATDAEWTTLIDFVDPAVVDPNINGLQSSIAGGILKEVGLAHWSAPNGGATNEYGFTSLPAGLRRSNGTYGNFGFWNYAWTTSENFSGQKWHRTSLYFNGEINRHLTSSDGKQGNTVRCISD